MLIAKQRQKTQKMGESTNVAYRIVHSHSGCVRSFFLKRVRDIYVRELQSSSNNSSNPIWLMTFVCHKTHSHIEYVCERKTHVYRTTHPYKRFFEKYLTRFFVHSVDFILSFFFYFNIFSFSSFFSYWKKRFFFCLNFFYIFTIDAAFFSQFAPNSSSATFIENKFFTSAENTLFSEPRVFFTCYLLSFRADNAFCFCIGHEWWKRNGADVFKRGTIPQMVDERAEMRRRNKKAFRIPKKILEKKW